MLRPDDVGINKDDMLCTQSTCHDTSGKTRPLYYGSSQLVSCKGFAYCMAASPDQRSKEKPYSKTPSI